MTNEQIQKLAEQAGFSLVDIRDAFYEEDNPFRNFVSLIAKECSEVCVKKSLLYAESDYMIAAGAAGCCALDIRNEFGVNND